MGALLKDWVVIYRQPHMSPFAYEFFCCLAEDYDHAEEQAINAYPNADVLWLVQTNDSTTAEEDWFTCGESENVRS